MAGGIASVVRFPPMKTADKHVHLSLSARTCFFFQFFLVPRITFAEDARPKLWRLLVLKDQIYSAKKEEEKNFFGAGRFQLVL